MFCEVKMSECVCGGGGIKEGPWNVFDLRAVKRRGETLNSGRFQRHLDEPSHALLKDYITDGE